MRLIGYLVVVIILAALVPVLCVVAPAVWMGALFLSIVNANVED